MTKRAVRVVMTKQHDDHVIVICKKDVLLCTFMLPFMYIFHDFYILTLPLQMVAWVIITFSKKKPDDQIQEMKIKEFCRPKTQPTFHQLQPLDKF